MFFYGLKNVKQTTNEIFKIIFNTHCDIYESFKCIYAFISNMNNSRQLTW